MRRFVLLCLAAGCVQAPEPLAELPQAITVQYERAPWLPDLFPVDAAAAGPRATAGMLRATVYAVLDGDRGIPVQDAATAIVANSGLPFRGASVALQHVRHLQGPTADAWVDAAAAADASDVQQTGAATAAVADGLCTRLGAATGLPELLTTMAGGSCRLALRGGDEILALAPGLGAPGQRIVLFAPPAPPFSVARALVIERLEPVDPQALAAALAAADADVVQRTRPTVDRTAERQLELAQQAVGERNRRPALLGLAQRVHAGRVVDLLLCADEAALRVMTAGLPASIDDGWLFERHVWQALLPQLQRDELAPGLRSCVLRQLGSLVYDPATLGALVATSSSAATFLGAVRDENLLALGDHDAGNRVRAHEWLIDHGGPVPGYDPLGPTAERQHALRAFHTAVTANRAAERALETSR